MPFPTDDETVARTEALLGRRLQADLRARLLRDNGGEIAVDGEAWQLHPVFDETNRRTLARTAAHLAHETAEARGWPRFPEGALAIASDGSGDHLILRPGSLDIERWDHETGAIEVVEVDWR